MATFEECETIRRALTDIKCNDQTQNISQECENHIKGVLGPDKTHDITQSINRCKNMCNKYSKYGAYKNLICDLIAKIKDIQKSIESASPVQKENEYKIEIKGGHHFYFDGESSTLHPFSNHFYKIHKSDIKTFFKLVDDNENVNISSMKEAMYYTSSTRTYHLMSLKDIKHGTKCNEKGNEKGKVVDNGEGGYLICKKSASIGGRKLRSTLNGKALIGKKTLKKLNTRYSECMTGPCWHKLSIINKRKPSVKKQKKQIKELKSKQQEGGSRKQNRNINKSKKNSKKSRKNKKFKKNNKRSKNSNKKYLKI